MNIEQGQPSEPGKSELTEFDFSSFPELIKQFGTKLNEVAKNVQNREWIKANADTIIDNVYQTVPEPITIAQLHGCDRESYFRLLDFQLQINQRLSENGFQPICPQRGDKWDKLFRTRSDRDLIWTDQSPDLHNTVHSVIMPGLIDNQEQKVIKQALARRYQYRQQH